ncbi:MAG: hypothetical protein ACFUZC_03515 [Chthoniobacteraceae bacterium]
MELTLTIPNDLAEKIASQIARQAEQIAAGNRLVTLKEATEITRHRRATLNAAAKSKQLAHYLIAGKPHFRVSDLWAWLNRTRVEPKPLN